MDVEQVLEDVGLKEGERKVYLSLLRLGSAPVHKLKEETQLHRTTIYDFLEKLLNKGLVSYVLQGKTKWYRATHPDKLLAYVKEKENHVKKVLPELKKLAEFNVGEVRVEVYKGVEGFKSMLNDYIRLGKGAVAFGVDEAKFKKRFPHIMEQLFRDEKNKGMKERILASDKSSFIYPGETTEYRYIPDEYFNPTPTLVYADRVANVIWEPLQVILITSKDLADNYRKQFEMLWKIAKKKP